MTTTTRLRPRPRRTLAIALTVLLAAAGCGGDSDEDATESAPSATASATGAPSATASATSAPSATASATSAPSATASAAGAPADDWQEVVDAANEEGEVVFFAGGNPELIDEVRVAFEADYPDIKLTHIPYSTNAEMFTRVDAEYASGNSSVDVILNGEPAWMQDMETRPDFFSEATGPDVLAAEEYGAFEYGRSGVVHSYLPFGVGWKPGGGGEEPDIEEIVKDSSYDHQLAVVDYSLGLPALTSWMLWEEQYGADFIEDLVDRQPAYAPNGTAAVQSVVSGQARFAWYTHYLGVLNAPGIEVAYPRQPLVLANFVSIIGRAPHPNAAQVFVNWLMTKSGQAAYNKGGMAAIPDVPGTVMDPTDDIRIFDTAEFTKAEQDAALARFNSLTGR